MLGLAAAAAIGCGEEEATPTPTATATAPAGQATATGTATATATATSVAQPRRGGTSVHGLGNLTAVLDPHTDLNQAIWVWNLISNTAIASDPKTWQMTPSLVESWEIPGDGTELILKVRRGIKWHNRAPTNGRELTAEDIAFNTMRIAGKLDPQNVARYQRRTGFTYLVNAEAVDNYTVRITLEKPNSAFLRAYMDWRNSIVAREQAEQGFEDPTKFVGTGPFTIDRWEDNGQRAEFKRNPDYWRKDAAGNPLPYLDSIRWNYLPDRATNVAAFISKEIDFLTRPSRTERQTISSAFRDAKLESWRFADWWHLRPSFNVKPYDDLRVRKAIFLAIDYKDINDAYFGEGFWSFTGPLAPSHVGGISSEEIASMPGWNPATKQQDIERAKQIMSEAGYADPDFSMKILQTSANTVGHTYETSVRLKDQFSKIWPNLKVELDLPPDGATFAQRLGRGDFEMTVYGAFPLPDPVLELTTHYSSTGGRNYGKFSSEEIDSLLNAALAELDEKKRDSMIRDVQLKLINDHVPLMPLVEIHSTTFVNPRIQGFSGLSGPGGFSSYDIAIFAEQYWLAG